jgi:protein-tyrosine phosphatase
MAVTGSVNRPRHPIPASLSHHSSCGTAVKFCESSCHIPATRSMVWREGNITAAMNRENAATITSTVTWMREVSSRVATDKGILVWYIHRSNRFDRPSSLRSRLQFTRIEELALKLLFVCTGNICRSPTAERLAVAYAAHSETGGFTASSAGTRAVIGSAIHDDAAQMIEKLGGDVTDFAARQLSRKIASDADLIITMTTAHRDKVLELAPHRLHRTFTLSEAACLISQDGARTIPDLAALRPRSAATSELMDIPDPIGQTAEVFEHCASLISNLLPPILELCRESSRPTDD